MGSSYLDPNNGWLEIGLESAYGQGASTFYNVGLVEPLDLSEELIKVQRSLVDPYGATLPSTHIKDKVTGSGECEVTAPPEDDTDQFPALSPILEAGRCGLSSSGTIASGPILSTYTPLGKLGGSAHFKWYHKDIKQDTWVLWEIKGVRCGWSFDWETGSRLTLSFDWEGLHATASAPGSPTVPTELNRGVDPQVFQNATVNYGGDINTEISAFSFDPGISLNGHETAESDTHTSEILTSTDQPSGSTDPVKTVDGMTAQGQIEESARNDETDSISVEVSDGAANPNIVRFTAPAAQWDNPDTSDDNGKSRYDASFDVHQTAWGENDAWKLELENGVA